MTSKVNSRQVLEIRKLSNEGVSTKEIAEKFKLSPEHTNKIIRRQAWAHLKDDGSSSE